MIEPFVKRIVHNYFGLIFQIFVAFVTTLVFIRTIGISGYAIMGITFSFLEVVFLFDIPFFLALVRFNRASLMQDMALFSRMVNTLLMMVLLSGFAIAIMLIPVIYFLSKLIYHDVSLLAYFGIGLLIIQLLRIIKFLNELVRANEHETIVQRANTMFIALEFVIVLCLLFILKLGVLSIFLSTLIARAVQLMILIHSIKKKRIVHFQPYFSKVLFMKALKESAFQNHLTRILRGLLFSGGLFLSSLVLSKHDMGILTLFTSNASKIQSVFSPLATHLVPWYSRKIRNEQRKDIVGILISATDVCKVLLILLIVFFATIGNFIFVAYYGSALEPYYWLFVLLLTTMAFWMSFTAQGSYLFVSNTRSYNILLACIICPFLPAVWLLSFQAGLNGAIIAFSLAQILIGSVIFIKVLKDLSLPIWHGPVFYIIIPLSFLILVLCFPLYHILSLPLLVGMFVFLCIGVLLLAHKKLREARALVHSL